MPSLNHTHKYRRVEMGKGKYPVYRCVLPNCSHYVPEEIVVGRISICWVCNEEMVIFKDRTNGVPVKPHHKSCTRKKDKSHVKPIMEVNPLEILENLANTEKEKT